ncbi:response regulator [Thiocystis violascens]|uniref:Response regulator containing a CheY-like receiver domain and an HTH DNA-binding domain n=1 Tax=Thiocystis violascens (strain ATCC 17096 / DSM 198 / 6111) TaxID=765911 RepID=I3YEZ8_THIV6|nr:response regulator transcription factor [Thiocystis violascens]AFL75566.1 response regulator containing a CheY-like receiver domain and an HTH DNA-binding domain [Thiocystis violascens DSM 198]
MSLSVILADDHPIVLQGLAALFRDVPDIALVGQATDGENAWRLIETYKPEVAILDLSMPGATGIELAARIESAAIGTQVVLLTMYENPFIALDAERAGVAGYVLKDSAFEELLLAVRIVAAGGTFMSAAVQAKLRALRRNGREPTPLSAREREVVKLISHGLSSKEIARALRISPGTVETYRKRLMQKLGLHSASEVVRKAMEEGLI